MDTYRRELLEQPAALAATAEVLATLAPALEELAARLRRGELDRVVVTGMGGSHHAGRPLALALAAAGHPSSLIETAELLHTCPALVTPRTLLVVVSQSGETVEVLRLLEHARRPAALVAVTNGADNTLARAADLTLTTRAGAERSVSSKSYVTSLLALDALAGALAGRPFAADRWEPAVAATAALLADWSAIEGRLVAALAERATLTLLGRGPSLASAEAGALVLKEAAHRPAEGLSAAQFRHGPLEMVGPAMGIIAFAPAAATRPLVLRLVAELAGYGAAVAVIGPAGPDLPPGPLTIETPPLDPWLAPLAELVPVQILSHALARLAGREPGRFERMGKVTREE